MTDRSFDVDLIRQLAELLDKTSLTEIEVEDEGVRIRVARTAATVAAAPPATTPFVVCELTGDFRVELEAEDVLS